MTAHPSPPRTVGIASSLLETYFGLPILEGIADFVRGRESWKLVTDTSDCGVHSGMDVTSMDASWHGDGMILYRATEEELGIWRARGVPVVLTSVEGSDLGYPRVVPSQRQIGALAAEHLIECAVPHIAFLATGEVFHYGRPLNLQRFSRERLAGFRDKLAEYSREPLVHYLDNGPWGNPQTWRQVEMEIADWLRTLPQPCGLFAASDFLGAVTLRVADRLGMRVPDDLAVIAFGNEPQSCFARSPALSTIAYPSREIGWKVAEILHRMMNGETLPPISRIEVPVGPVIARESTGILAIDDPMIRDLVRHIRLTAPRNALRVSELVERSKLSPTTIKDRFAACLGHGPKQEIQHVRLTHLKTLLADRSLSLPQIVARMNFGTTRELSRFFLAATGQRPAAFRKSLETADPQSVSLPADSP